MLRAKASGAPWSTFVASLQLDDQGLVARYLAYACSPAVVPGPAVMFGEAPTDALQVLDRYFDALDGGEFEAAAECFSDDVVYSHPPYRHTDNAGDERVEFRGRQELLRGFRARGMRTFTHRIVVSVQRGTTCLLEGVVEGLPTGRDGGFLSSLTLDRAGLIRRYLSFYCEPSVGGT